MAAQPPPSRVKEYGRAGGAKHSRVNRRVLGRVAAQALGSRMDVNIMGEPAGTCWDGQGGSQKSPVW